MVCPCCGGGEEWGQGILVRGAARGPAALDENEVSTTSFDRLPHSVGSARSASAT